MKLGDRYLINNNKPAPGLLVCECATFCCLCLLLICLTYLVNAQINSNNLYGSQDLPYQHYENFPMRMQFNELLRGIFKT